MQFYQRFKWHTIIVMIAAIMFSCSPAKKLSSTAPVEKDSPVNKTPKTLMDDNIAPEKDVAKTDSFLEKLLNQYPRYFKTIQEHKDDYRLQIIYTRIDRNAENKPDFKDFYFNVNPSQYFYPASTVKMPVAALALQKVNELHINGLDGKTPMITENAYSGQTPVYNDPTTVDGCPNIEQYIKKIFLVSDNDAFNRLYEFTGQQYINEQLHEKGYAGAEILHRLNIFLSQDENRHTNPVQFRDTSGNIIYNQSAQYNTKPHIQRNDRLGKGYYKGGVLINEPMNFSLKNRISLEELHQVLKSIVFPFSVPEKQRFNITADQRSFLLRYMSQLPHETTYPFYDSTYYDAFAKYLLLGSNIKAKLPEGLRIFNKIGGAYGFLIDVAYIADFKNNIEFMLSAVIYCNKDDIINDDTYEYEETGFPFMQHLGEVIYDFELKRKRKQVPDLSEFKMEYGK